MPRIHVCPLSHIDQTIRETGARRMVTLINPNYPVARPAAIAEPDHLYIGISDIVEHAEGQILPGEAHVADLLQFVRAWDRKLPLLVHCYMGISRSTAAAFIAACALRPDRGEDELARIIRARSPTAMPNARLVSLADAMLRRDGRMIAALAGFPRSEILGEGTPFHIEID